LALVCPRQTPFAEPKKSKARQPGQNQNLGPANRRTAIKTTLRVWARETGDLVKSALGCSYCSVFPHAGGHQNHETAPTQPQFPILRVGRSPQQGLNYHFRPDNTDTINLPMPLWLQRAALLGGSVPDPCSPRQCS